MKILIAALYVLSFALPTTGIWLFLRHAERSLSEVWRKVGEQGHTGMTLGGFDEVIGGSVVETPTRERDNLRKEMWFVGSGLFAGMAGGVLSLL